MSYEEYCQTAEVLNEKLLKKICKKKLNIFYDFLKKAGVDLELFADEVSKTQYNLEMLFENDQDADKADKLYQNIIKTFKEKTGLSICLAYHDRDNDSDEVDGIFWCVENVWQKTEPAKKYEKYIENKSWIVFS